MGTGLSFAVFWEPTPHIGLPCPALKQGKVLSVTTTWHALFCWYLCKACPFLNRNGGEVDGVGRQRGGVGEGLKGEKGKETVDRM